LEAGKIMLGQIAGRVRRRESFAFETTLSGLNYARHIPTWRQAGYHVKLVFLSLPFGRHGRSPRCGTGANRRGTMFPRWSSDAALTRD
jgi:hypothetical protein